MRRERVAQRIWFLNKPLFAGIVPIRLKQVPGEILAGVTLAALAIPEVMGYTKIAGMPVITGLYTLLIPAALFAIFGSSRHLVVGADSATAAILASALIGMAAVGSDQYVALAMALSIMVGLILLVASLLGLGFMADFLSRTVLVGFLSGVGVQVALHAVIDLLGVKLHESLAGSLMALVSHEWSANTLAVALAALTIIILLAGKLFERRYKRRLPLAILVVIGAITLSWLFDFGAHMPVVGKVPTGFPTLEVPDVDLRFSLVWTLLPTALAMAVIVLAQSAATARAFANRYHETVDEERDLFGLGLANIGAGLSGTFVVNGSPTKTEMADEAGGRTQLTMLVTVVVVALTLLFLTAPLSYLPDAVLSAVVFLIGVSLIDVRGLTDVYDKRRAEFWIALSTAAVVVLFGVEKGIAFAVLLAVIGHTRHGYHPADLLLARDADGDWCGEPLSSRTQAEPGLLIYRFGHSMYFANAPRMRTEIQNLVRDNTVPVRWFCIDISMVDDIDYTAQAVLQEIAAELRAKSIRLVFAQNVAQANAVSRQEVETQFGADSYFASLRALTTAFEASQTSAAAAGTSLHKTPSQSGR